MGEKSERKKQYIVEKARGVFAQKGFKAVTMKDIVEACEISRGGLYLYFGSTREIFEAVMAAENEDDEDVALSRAINDNASASDMLAIFIKAQKKEVFRKRNNLTVASYEYFTEITGATGQDDLKSRFETAVMIVERLILSGIDAGEFICDNPTGWARNLMFVIEGMKVSAHTMGVTEAMFDREMLYVLGNLVAYDDSADAQELPEEETEAPPEENADSDQENTESADKTDTEAEDAGA